MKAISTTILAAIASVAILIPSVSRANPIERFFGSYSGVAEFALDGETEPRDLSTVIAPTNKGFEVTWTSVIYREDGRRTEKSYTIEFLPSDRANIYGSAMKSNVFGKQVPLDPLKGEPFVWSRIEGATLSVFSLFIEESGEYVMQEYHRSLSEGGLDLRFLSQSSGVQIRTIEAFLLRED